MRRFALSNLAPAKSAWLSRVGSEVSKVSLGYMIGSGIMSLAAGFVIFITLICVSVPFALLFGIWVPWWTFSPRSAEHSLAYQSSCSLSFTRSVQDCHFCRIYDLHAAGKSRSTTDHHESIVKINALTVFIAILIGAKWARGWPETSVVSSAFSWPYRRGHRPRSLARGMESHESAGRLRRQHGQRRRPAAAE